MPNFFSRKASTINPPSSGYNGRRFIIPIAILKNITNPVNFIRYQIKLTYRGIGLYLCSIILMPMAEEFVVLTVKFPLSVCRSMDSFGLKDFFILITSSMLLVSFPLIPMSVIPWSRNLPISLHALVPLLKSMITGWS